MSPSIHVFSDFDGTICLEDTGCILIDAGIGAEKRIEMDVKILNHEMTFLEAMDQWWGHVNVTYDEGLALLKPCELDPAFKKVFAYLNQHQIPFTILSCGLDIVIRDYLSWTLGKEEAANVEILANYCKVEDKNWIVTYRDTSPHSHDKSVAIKEARAQKKEGEDQIIVFCGDGISDLSAAREADVLFARRGKNLEKYCRTHKIPFLAFDTFEEVYDIVHGLNENKFGLDHVAALQNAEIELSTEESKAKQLAAAV
ncbi:hypothetical protein BGZ83_001270 [Gryganskiella cystojenkinii]|nr:hypothetical protein BGZ83_001270 [Gryganskiella cystojenkinii]